MAIFSVCGLGLAWSCSSSSSSETTDPVSYSCASPPADLAGCTQDADCMTVEIGCYCGAQPVNGIARKYAATARSCEQTAASSCALGCPNQPGQVAQDGKMVSTGTSVVAHCDRSSGAGVCKSSVSSKGPSDPPPPSGW